MKIPNDFQLEFQTREQMEGRQLEWLRAHVRHCREHSPHYRAALRDMGPLPDHSLSEALRALPLTAKQDLEADNDAFCAVPPRAVVDMSLSSGTTGRATRIVYTEHDLQRLAYNEAKALSACGLGREDVILLTCTMDRCFIAGLAYFLGARALGAASLRNGQGSLASHAELLQRMRPTAIVGVPSFMNKLGLYLKEQGVDPAAIGVQRMVAIGEPLRDRTMALLPVGRELEALWGARVHSTYASSETVTTFCECAEQNGGHLQADLALVEILDEAQAPLPPGAVGEVVVTPLAVEGMPLLRFRTGDIGFVQDAPCPCGRNTVRLGPILGRKAQMLKVRGTTLYPPAILAVLAAMDGVGECYVSARRCAPLSDEVTVHVALRCDAAVSAEEIALRLQARLRVKPLVAIEPEERVRQVVYNPKYRKPVRFVRE